MAIRPGVSILPGPFLRTGMRHLAQLDGTAGFRDLPGAAPRRRMARTGPGMARQAGCRADSANAPRPARPAIGGHRRGFSVLIGAHKWALAEGGGLRLVIPASSPVLRVFRAIGLGRFIPRFASLEQALAQDLSSPPIERVTREPDRR